MSTTFLNAGDTSTPIDVSQLTGDYTLRIRFSELSASEEGAPSTILLAIDTSSNGYSAYQTVTTLHTIGPLAASPQMEYSVRAWQIPLSRFGQASMQVRLRCQSITATTTAVCDMTVEA